MMSFLSYGLLLRNLAFALVRGPQEFAWCSPRSLDLFATRLHLASRRAGKLSELLG